MLFSINFAHWGSPKQWYCIPESDREKFDQVVKQKYKLLIKNDPNVLLDVITMISPAYLQQQGVTVYKTLQKPGEFILTLPGAYHAGFSTGLNIGEAGNFAAKNWFDFGYKCRQLYRKSGEKIPVFPIEWLLVQNAKHLSVADLDKETVTCLRDRYREMLLNEKDSRLSMEMQLPTGTPLVGDFP